MPNADETPAANQDDESEHELHQKTKDVARATKEMVESAVAGLKLMELGSAAANEANASGATEDAKESGKSFIASEQNRQALLQAMTDAMANTRQQAKKFAFWSTQPVTKLDELVTTNECIEPNKKIDDIRAEPYTLPSGFKWVTLDLNDASDLKELYTLLNENYVEDDDAMFRFDYQPEFLKWSLQPPGWKRDWHVGVRVEKSGKLVGFISAIPSKLRTYEKVLKVVDINFLCVHKKLRSKRVAPVLIREITRRVNLTGIFQAAYTAGVVLPTPVSTCRYWHRSLNPKKLVDVRFSHLARNMTMQRTVKLYKLPDQPKTKGYRRITAKDMDKAHKLLEDYLKRFSLGPMFTKEEFKHWFTPRDGIIDCFIVADEKGNITDLTSYYCLPSSVMHHPVHKNVRAAYSFYNVSTKTPWIELMNDALISARNVQMDVYNALDLMENKKFFVPLKFGAGDGNLQYYLYNWRCPAMQPEDIALILM
ncbi:glycylpeptide N-tetradecanoyltransferase [Drosophila sulfurigaster albostrigata]|uniref:Glycylpeptide N-tetradecanoyltransferase n=1 Tax=Drosophila albomicans TaxID=7291 RepID=A0A6P8WH48_DROAB|nr:glycylpeptide N-tetradecanoyltransferase [Drosophila albomicans]XP_060651944.1 glycylpeptide N-tetradecanoyltransferase [Drosophila nasuta]XP_062134712.1 glycylpeptide N-tetradecanoyltransferase [Drosophila sulfurigaster albostrigata]